MRLGSRTDKATEIIAGVLPGEVVAAKGSDVAFRVTVSKELIDGLFKKE